MTIPAPPFVECDQVHPVLVVSDIPAAIDFYTKKLGFKLAFTWGGDPPTYAGVNLGKVQMFLQKGTPSPKGCSVSFLVADAGQLCEFHRANGVEVTAEIADREYGNQRLRRARPEWIPSLIWAPPVQHWAADQD